MIQLIVSGKVEMLTEDKPGGGGKLGYVAQVHEKVWTGEKEVIRIWNVSMDVYQGERLKKAMVQIKYFGFVCDALRIESEYNGANKSVTVWLHARGMKFFTL